MSRLKTDAIRNVNASVDGITLDTSGNVAIPNELQLADKIVHTGDTNTAIRFLANDTVSVETGAAERFRITSDGSVMFGSGVPSEDLHLKKARANFLVEGTNDTVGGNVANINVRAPYYRRAGYSISDTGGNEDFWIGRPYGEGDSNAAVAINMGGTEKLRIDSSGKVGIGLTNPTAKLQIKGVGGTNGVGILTTDASGNNVFWTHDGGKVGLHYNPLVINQDIDSTDCPSGSYFYVHHASHPFLIKNDGKVGIGTTSPDQLLHIADAVNPVIRLENTDASLGQDQLIGAIEFEKQDASGVGVGVCGSIKLHSDDSYGARSYLSIGTRHSTAVGGPTVTESLRVKSDGDVSIINGNLVVASGHGISFINAADTATGETVSSSVLDDYEEGSCVMTYSPASGSFAAHIYTSGKYVKIGRMVTVTGSISLNGNTNASGRVDIIGWPYAPQSINSTWSLESGHGVIKGHYNYPDAFNMLVMNNGGTNAYVYDDAGNYMQVGSSGMGTGYNECQCSFTMTYYASA